MKKAKAANSNRLEIMSAFLFQKKFTGKFTLNAQDKGKITVRNDHPKGNHMCIWKDYQKNRDK